MARRKPVAKAAPAASSEFLDLGLPSLKIRNGRIDEEWRERLRGKKKFKVYREMGDADVTAGGFLHQLQYFLGKVPLYLKPREIDGATTPAGEAMAKRVSGAFEDMEDTPAEMRAEIVNHAARDGSAPMEVTYKICRGETEDPMFRSDFSDGLIAWRSWGIRPLESVDRWGYDSKTNTVTSLVQITEPDYRTRTIPIDKLLIFKFRGSKGSPEGVSMLSIAERAYYFKKLLEELEAIGAKRDLCGLPFATAPIDVMHPGANADRIAAKQQLVDAVTLVDRDELEGLVFPAAETPDGKKTGYTFQLLASAGTRQFDLDRVIRRLRGEMSVGLGAAFMYAGMDGVGARSLDESKQDAFRLACESILKSICEVLDCAVVDMMRLNRIPRELWPTFQHEEIDDVALTEFAGAINAGLQSGALTHDDELESEYRAKAQVKPRKGPSVVPMLAPADVADPAPAAPPVPAPKAEEPDAFRNLMSMKQVRQILGVGKTRVEQLVSGGALGAKKVMGLWRFDPDEVRKYLDSAAHQIEPDSENETKE